MEENFNFHNLLYYFFKFLFQIFNQILVKKVQYEMLKMLTFDSFGLFLILFFESYKHYFFTGFIFSQNFISDTFSIKFVQILIIVLSRNLVSLIFSLCLDLSFLNLLIFDKGMIY